MLDLFNVLNMITGASGEKNRSGLTVNCKLFNT
jgi:hypothetical protein